MIFRHSRISRPRHRRSRLRSRSTQAAAILLAAVAAIFGLSVVGGYSSVAFTSGSMAPTIDEGALAITRTVNASEVTPGDVVSVTAPDGERVTHRVVDVDAMPGVASLTLRGDANASADPVPYVVQTADEVVFTIPLMGHWSGAGLPILVAVALLSMVVLARGRLRGQRPGPRHRATSDPTGARTGASILAGLGLIGVAVFGAAPTSAYWIDSGKATSGNFSTAATIPAPSYVGCVDHDDHVDATWTNVGQRYNYVAALVTATTPAALIGGQSTPYAGELNSVAQITRHIKLSDFGATTADLGFPARFNFNVRVYAQAVGVPAMTGAWSSSTYITVPVHFESVDGTTYKMRCGHDLNTFVDITAIGQDTGSSSTDLITRVAANTVVGTGEPGSTISVRRGGVQIGTATVAADGTWSAAVTLTEGTAAITAIATDIFGHTAQDSANVVLDTIAPTVTPTSTCTAANVGNPVAGVAGSSWCKQTSQSWTATYADNTGGSGLVAGTGRQYNNNGAGWTNYTAAVSMAEANGRVMQARATDVAGNTTTVSNTYYIDGTAPTLTVTAPTSGTSLSLALLGPLLDSSCGGNIACGTTSDGVSGVAPAAVQWKLIKQGGLLGSNTCYTVTGTTACGTYAFQPTGGTLPAWRVLRSRSGFYTILSSYTFTAQVTDRAGNLSTVTVNFSTVL